MQGPIAPIQSKNQAAVIRAELIGDSIATAAGVTATGFAPLLELCRALIAAGHDSTKPLHAYRGDMLCMTVRSIGEGARLDISSKGVGFVPRSAVRTAPPMRYSAPAATGHRAHRDQAAGGAP